MTDGPHMATPIFSLREISKHYGAVVAVEGVDLDVHRGDVLALCGDNGAGKSTLIKIMSGAETPTGGTLRLNGTEVTFGSPHDALAQGVATIYQDLALAPRLAIYENVFMGAELYRSVLGIKLLDKAGMARAAKGYLSRLAIGIDDMRRPVEGLSGGQRQAVAISRALLWNADIIIMDEPTAALGVKETAQVLELVQKLKDEGHTIVLISHNMADVVRVATRVAILRNGRKTVDRDIDGLTAEDLGRMIMTDASLAA